MLKIEKQMRTIQKFYDLWRKNTMKHLNETYKYTSCYVKIFIQDFIVRRSTSFVKSLIKIKMDKITNNMNGA